MAGPTRKIQDFGLTEVYSSLEKPAQVDIVLVHGLNGHPQNTWTSKHGVFWPSELLPEFLESLRVRILSYGYNANVTSFTDGVSKDNIHHHAETLAAGLAANRNLRNCAERPIVFVCHSLGGLVVKRTLILCRSVENEKVKHLRAVYVSTFGILFLGTPHNGSDAAKWGLLLQKICSAVLPKRFLDTSPQLIEALKNDNENLQNINRLFNDSVSRFHIYFFHETKPLDLKGTRQFIVDEASAAPDLEGVERMGIEADHSSMCKFEDDNSPGFEAVAEAIVRYSREAPSLIAGRWAEEKQYRQLLTHARAREVVGSLIDVSTTGNVSDSANGNKMGNSWPFLPPRPRHSAGNSSPQRLGYSVDSLSAQGESLFVVPPGFHPNAHFFGMQRELNELHARLLKAKRRAERVVAVLICGGPGSGKTHLARQYVHLHRKDYPGGIFWVDAKSRQSISNCFWDIAQAAALVDRTRFKKLESKDLKDPSAYVDDVRNWFQSREEWLLVFDGLSFDEDGDINKLKPYLPFSKNSGIIYTSVDRTLWKKQRLFEPYCLMVRPLEVEDARRLLFKDLNIRKPTVEQMNKATELVKHYQCLPLAIHAISHRLSMNSKPMEKYHINSHFTDQKLAEPFLSIMHDLYERQHFEALNLINLLAFFGHHIPVGLINWGRGALASWNVQILTSSRLGERGDIDTTLGVLIRYGLIERVSDPYVTNRKSTATLDGNDDQSVDDSAVVVDSSESFTDNSQEPIASVYQSTLDVIKIHSVVQGFCRDELKLMDEEIKKSGARNNHGRAGSGEQNAGFYASWLIVATKVLCRSYENARNRMKELTGSGFVKDYREYETHAERLVDHFPKKVHAHPSIVREARESLREVVKNIKKEITQMSPNASEESLRHEKSIFDRSSSSSSGPTSSIDGGASRRSTWNADDIESIKVESPQDIVAPLYRDGVRLDLFPPHIYRDSSDEKDDGYLTDGEGGKTVTRRPSPCPTQMSQATNQATEKAKEIGQGTSDESGWEIVKRRTPQSRDSSGDKRKYRGRTKRNLGEYRPIPALVKLSSAQAEGSLSRTHETSDKGHTNSSSDVKSILAAYHKFNAHGYSSTNAEASDRQKENQISWAKVAAAQSPATTSSAKGSFSSDVGSPARKLGLKTKLSLESLSSRSSQPSPLSTEARQTQLNALNRSDPGLVLGPHFGTGDARSAPGSRYHSRNPSAVMTPDRRQLSASPPRRLAELSIADLSYNQKIAMTSERRIRSPHRPPLPAVVAPSMHAAKPIQSQGFSPVHPSAIMPGTSPPTGYMSEPASAPMSRGPSGQSNDSWHTEPVPYSPSVSQPPGIGYHYQARPANSFAQDAIPVHSDPSTSYMVRGRGCAVSDSLTIAPAPWYPAWTRFEYGGEPDTTQTIRFGEHEIDIGQARQRLADWERRQDVPAAPSITTPRLVPPVFHMTHSGSDVGTAAISKLTPSNLVQQNSDSHLRSESCPPQPNYPGLGLRLEPGYYPRGI